MKTKKQSIDHLYKNPYKAKEMYKRRKRERRNAFIMVMNLVLLVLVTITILLRGLQFSWYSLIPSAVLLLAVGLIILNAVTDVISRFFSRHKKGTLLVTTVAVLAVITYFCLFPQACLGDPLPARFSQFYLDINKFFPAESLFGYYTAQLSLTFISISVMSVLSDKSVVIYWSNVSKARLIDPTFSCFAAYTYYSIAATVGSGLGVIFRSGLLFVTCFAINILVLILLTSSVIDVYYSRDTKKKKLVRKLRRYSENIFNKAGVTKKYEQMMLSLKQNITTAAAGKDLLFLQEIYELVVREPSCFNSPLGREAVDTLISTLDDGSFSLLAQAMDENLQVQRDKVDALTERLENGDGFRVFKASFSDSPLWEALSKNGCFISRLATKPYTDGDAIKQAKYFEWIIRRMDIDYQRCLTFYFYNNPEGLQKAERYRKPDWQTFDKVMDFAFNKAEFFDSSLFIAFARLLTSVLKDCYSRDDLIALLKNSFYPYYILDQIEFLDIQDNLREEMVAIFRDHHPDPTLRKRSKWATPKP